MESRDGVGSFIETHDLHTSPEYRIPDLLSEVAEVGKNVNTATEYGARPEDVRIQEDELGDVLFAVYALAHETGIGPHRALAKSLDKYRSRMTRASGLGSETP